MKFGKESCKLVYLFLETDQSRFEFGESVFSGVLCQDPDQFFENGPLLKILIAKELAKPAS